MRINRFLPLIIPLIVFTLTEVLYFSPRLIYVSAVLIILLFFFTTRQFTVFSDKDEKWWNFFILPVFFTLNMIVFVTMIPNFWLVQLLFFGNLIFLYMYFRSIYYYLTDHGAYKKHSMENFSAYANFVSVYLLASAVFGLQAFLNASIAILMTVFLIEILLIVYQVLWANKIDMKMGFFFVMLAGLALIEIAWTVSFLTLSYYILGLIVAVCYYILIGLIRFYLLGTLTESQIKHYLVFGFSSILVVLLTARWL